MKREDTNEDGTSSPLVFLFNILLYLHTENGLMLLQSIIFLLHSLCFIGSEENKIHFFKFINVHQDL